MKTIKLELSVKILLGAISVGLFLNIFSNFPPKANADDSWKEGASKLLSDEDFVNASLTLFDRYLEWYIQEDEDFLNKVSAIASRTSSGVSRNDVKRIIMNDCQVWNQNSVAISCR